MISRDVRDLALMSYFCQDLTAETSTLMGLKPLVAPFNSVGVSIFSDQLSCLPLPDQHIMAVLNASLVALCSCSPENVSTICYSI